jgi:NUMOD4 motif/HNH endonuclease
MRTWKDIAGTGGRYQVSDDGFVRSLPEIDSRGRFVPGVILKSSLTEKGYVRVTIDRVSHRVHRLVAEAFIDNPLGHSQVNHRNGSKVDNRRENLEWVNNSQNQLHRYAVLGHKPALLGNTGAACANSKPVIGVKVDTKEQVRFAGAAEAGRQLGIHSSGISACATGKLRTYKGWQWAYEG